MAVHVIEHRCQRVRCPDCGQRQTACYLARWPTAPFGPRLAAAVVTLSVRNRISRRDVVELCEQLLAARISTGSVEAILPRASDALAEPYADPLEEIRLASAVNMDETGWRLRGTQRAPGARSPIVTRCWPSRVTAMKIMPRRCWALPRRS